MQNPSATSFPKYMMHTCCCLVPRFGQVQVSQGEQSFTIQRRRQNAINLDFGMDITEKMAACIRENVTMERQRGMDEVIFVRDAEEVMIAMKHSIASKRKLAAAAMVAAMEVENFGPIYSNQLVSKLGHFLDMIITKAILLKHIPSYTHLSFSTRARFCIEDSKVVALIRWLKHNHVTASRIGEVLCCAREHLEVIRFKVQWLKKLNVRGRDLGMVLTTEPGIIITPFRELNHTVAILDMAGLRREWMGLVISHAPSVLVETHDRLHRKIILLNKLGIDDYRLGTMAFNFPAMLGRVSVEDIEEKVEYLRSFNLNEHTIGEMLVERPQLLGCSIHQSWELIVKFLSDLGVDRLSMQRILTLNPSILCLDLATDIVPKVEFLRTIGVHEQVIGQVTVDFPPFLTSSLNRRIRPLVQLLLDSAGVSEEKIGKVIATQPELIGCSTKHKLMQNVNLFLSMGVQRHELGQMIAEFPMLIKYGEPVIRPKYLYFKRVMRRPLAELIEFPRYFSYALQTRITVRHQLLTQRGLNFQLRQMLACRDEEFSRRVHAACYNNVKV